MSKRLFTVDDPFSRQFSEIIDVRTPLEFDEDHIPGAINLPVLTDEERKMVGTVYKQESPFKGRKMGAGIIAGNIGVMLQKHFSSKEEGYHPLVYCWRGGQRSRSLGTILSEIGWEVSLLNGGYKQYRARVRDLLDELPRRFAYCVLTGLTGSGKSRLLELLEQRGEQVIHLEALAKHQGSLLGAYTGEAQPSQKLFESALLRKLSSFSAKRRVWVEAESQKIGELFMPKALRETMLGSKSIFVEVPVKERVKFLIREYPHFISDPESLRTLLLKLKQMQSREVIEEWISHLDAQRWDELVESLLVHHYDPRYGKALMRNYSASTDRIRLETLEATDLERAAALLCEKDAAAS